RQWWNVPAKYAKAQQIADDERRRSTEAATAGGARAHNNRFDAMRHAEWSRRMATEIDPISARVFGAAHELEGAMPSPQTLQTWGAPRWLREVAQARDWHDQPEAEALMDVRNNAEGRRAAAEGRAINPANLQVGLDQPVAGNPAYPRARPRGAGPGRR
ncbi:MAG TPA: hypothetical protein VF474_14430, partial [Phenylobacterium sp.]